MIDYIWNRIHALRRNNVVDFMTEYMKKSGAELENMRNHSSDFHTNSLYTDYYAKVKKNMKSSEDKQTKYRHGEKNK